MIVTLSPHPCNEQETLRSLRYGARAQNIRNVAKVNKEYSAHELSVLLKKAEDKIKRLEARIRVLKQVVVDLGGSPPTDKEAEDLALQIEAQIVQQSSNVLEQEVKKQEAEGAALDLGQKVVADEKAVFYGDQAKQEKDALYQRFSIKQLPGSQEKVPDSSTAAAAGVVSMDAYQ